MEKGLKLFDFFFILLYPILFAIEYKEFKAVIIQEYFI